MHVHLLGMGLRALCLLDKSSTTEPHSQSPTCILEAPLDRVVIRHFYTLSENLFFNTLVNNAIIDKSRFIDIRRSM